METGPAEVEAADVIPTLEIGITLVDVMLRVLVIIWKPTPPAISATITTAIITIIPMFRLVGCVDILVTVWTGVKYCI